MSLKHFMNIKKKIIINMPLSYIKKLSLEGFKSFRHRTEIVFEKGFNAIVGPNGSGKSNLLDACVFVFGFPSKLLRAGKMENVIYCGGPKKKKTRFCIVEAEIIKTNPDGSENKINIERKINQNGVSYYRLNDKASSKADIDKVLEYANIKPKSNNIIQQGDITNILKIRPKDRREVIDEIAGISDFNEKKIKAFAELEIAERNLEGVAIAHSQKKEYYEKVKKEKEFALKYRQIEDQLRQLKLTLAYSNLKGAEDELQNIEENLQIKKQEINLLSDKIEKYDKQIIEREEALQRREEKIITSISSENNDLKNIQMQISELKVKIVRRESEIESKQSRTEELNELIKNTKNINSSSKTGHYAINFILNSKINGIKDIVENLYSTEDKYATAMFVALGGHLKDIVVENEDCAIKCINVLKNNNLGRVRFLPLSRLNYFQIGGKAQMSSQMPGVIDFAKNLCKYDENYEIVFNYILRDTLVVENNEYAKMLKSIRCITLDGNLYEAGGAIVGGKIKQKQDITDNLKSKNTIIDYEKKIEKLNKEILENQKEIQDLEKLLYQKQKKELELQGENNLSEFYEEKKRHTTEIEDLKYKRKENYEEKNNLEREISDLSFRKIRLQNDYENFKIEYNTYDENQMKDFQKESPVKLKRKIRELERQIEQFGMVNLKAIEECEIYEKQFSELNEKLDKLKKEKQLIIDNINNMEIKRRTLFFDALNMVSIQFNKIFSKLMDGGQAHLELEKEGNLDSGLLIKTKVNNVERNIDALSGGEKTLTAFAFLFAIQQYRPSLFYILDEIDAALDKENANKISNLIKNKKDAQFLLISHNEYTVRNADRVYGISMQNDESRIFSIKL